MTLRNYSSTAAQTTLSGGVDASTTTLTVSATTGFPAVPFVLAIDAGAAAQELVLVTNVAGTTLTVTRAFDSTVASAHDTGAVVQHSHAALDFREANTHVNATSAHGSDGTVMGANDVDDAIDAALAPTLAAWSTWTPTVTSETGAFTTVSGAGRYLAVGKTVHFTATLTITTVGSAAGGVRFTLPVNARAAGVHIGDGRETNTTGAGLYALADSTTLALVKRYDNGSPIGAGYILILSGTYETA